MKKMKKWRISSATLEFSASKGMPTRRAVNNGATFADLVAEFPQDLNPTYDWFDSEAEALEAFAKIEPAEARRVQGWAAPYYWGEIYTIEAVYLDEDGEEVAALILDEKFSVWEDC